MNKSVLMNCKRNLTLRMSPVLTSDGQRCPADDRNRRARPVQPYFTIAALSRFRRSIAEAVR